MVSINPNSRNVQAKLLKTDAAKNLGEPETLEKTTGNNNGAVPKINVNRPCYAIRGGDGTKANPYVLDGNDNDEDFKYLQSLADKYQRNIEFELPDGRKGRVTPD